MIAAQERLDMRGGCHAAKILPVGVRSTKNVWCLRADVSKHRPEVYKSEKSKILKKIHKVALGKLLTQMYILLRSDNYFRRTGGLLVSWLSDQVLRARDHESQKNRFKYQINCNANNK